MTHRANRRRWFIGVGAITAAWLVVAAGIVPWLIRSAHAGRSASWINAILAGRAQHPVERYLQVWYGVAWKLTVAAVVVGILFVFRRQVGTLFDRVVRQEPAVGAGPLVGLALVWGLLAGLAEGVHILVRKTMNPMSPATFDQSVDAIWMAPVGEAVVFVGMALVAVVLLRAWRKPVSFRLATGFFAFLACLGLLRSARLGLGAWALALLALGIGVQLSHWITTHRGRFRGGTARAAVALVALVVLVGFVPQAAARFGEDRTIADLPQADPDSPNVLLLILDTVRAASMGLHGYGAETTPHLEAFAEEGTVFDAAISPTSWTLPSHASMFTGYLPWEMFDARSVPLGGSWPTLAEVLASRGYVTAGFVANYYNAGRAAGLTRGFVRYEDGPISPGMVAMNSWWLQRLVLRVRAKLGVRRFLAHKDAGQVTGSFLEWLSGRRGDDRPFMALLNFMDAHEPYYAPDSILRRFVDEPTPGGPFPAGSGDARRLSELRARYDAGIAYIDQEMGRLFDTLQALDLLDETIVIVTSDHGQQLGERDGLTSHGNSLYHTSIHVPLVIRYPAAVPAGVRVAGAVSLRRIPATVLDLLGERDSEPFPGVSLAREWSSDRAVEGTEILPASMLFPSPFSGPEDPVARGPMVSVTSRRWHWIRNGDGVEELYDVLADPWELEDRSRDPEVRDVLDRLRSHAPRGITR